jgi:hypothetical protein
MRALDVHRSPVSFSLGGFGFPLALFGVAIVMVIATCILGAGLSPSMDSPTMWQEMGVFP